MGEWPGLAHYQGSFLSPNNAGCLSKFFSFLPNTINEPTETHMQLIRHERGRRPLIGGWEVGQEVVLPQS